MFGLLKERVAVIHGESIPSNVLNCGDKKHIISTWASIEFAGQKFLHYPRTKALHDVYTVRMRNNKFIYNGTEILRQTGQKLLVNRFLQKGKYIVLEAYSKAEHEAN